MYFVKYNTGAGDFTVDGTLEEAQVAADEGAAYTQRNIDILNENGEVVCYRRWWGTEFDKTNYDEDEAKSVICFGDFGYYDNWA